MVRLTSPCSSALSVWSAPPLSHIGFSFASVFSMLPLPSPDCTSSSSRPTLGKRFVGPPSLRTPPVATHCPSRRAYARFPFSQFFSLAHACSSVTLCDISLRFCRVDVTFVSVHRNARVYNATVPVRSLYYTCTNCAQHRGLVHDIDNLGTGFVRLYVACWW